MNRATRLIRCGVFLVWLPIAGLLGCNGGQNPSGGVAVIDLDLVAKRIGRQQKLEQELTEKQRELNSQLQAYEVSLRQLFDRKKQEIGGQPAAQQQRQLTQISNQLNAQFVQAQRGVNTNLNRQKQELIAEFRQEVVPFARQVANDRGLYIVITKNEALYLTYDPALDITEEVAERMLAAKGKESVNSPPPSQEANVATRSDTTTR